MNLTWRNPSAHHWGKVFRYLSVISPCFSCSSAGLLGHFPGTTVWRSRPGLWHSYAERSNGLGVGFPAPSNTNVKGDVMTSPSPAPQVMLRIYDFENDVFVDTVRLGQVVELEITIRDGKVYQGSVSDCDAVNYNGTRFPVVRNL
ncbi:ZP domain-containing protein [Trichonephila clavipes]|nr:ZP domain-containing protein [Trichonephila clavipes]